ncbi:MAG: hypothetical protein DWQ44_03300 [Bacteroidetes bacterium]|nr:MAG: hypothetical protein DWQ33_04505 [Bacteroidota bacterium]REJ99975.1 MAG: hypothetical protein DWQ39_13775 [Bacteroidota bacterium]REK35845.1 MAG: hypothetical protein DWQ44_03300 [Bacteroidota bacterium]REK50678.1 MAG: hypothetical protein DWQ48_05065 [Bacteroidota bacterium]
MSSREIQHYIFQNGQFTFSDGATNEGMVISRYNISLARIEYYFIPDSNILAYRSARAQHDVHAHKSLGHLIDISKITSAQLIN